MTVHWSEKYLGKPWVAYATGPDSFDCWGLVYRVLLDDFKFSSMARFTDVVPGHVAAFHRAVLCEIGSGKWRVTTEPQDGDVVLLGRRRTYSHVGVVAGQSILNVRAGVGVCRESKCGLEILGFNLVEYWTYVR